MAAAVLGGKRQLQRRERVIGANERTFVCLLRRIPLRHRLHGLRRVLQRRTEPEAKLYLKLLEERETGAENGAARPAEERKANPSAVLRKMKTTSGGALSMLGKALSSSGKSERGSGA